MRTKFICLVGIDGSGKSTLAENVIANLRQEGLLVHYGHIYHQPLLLLPLKWIARKIFLKGKEQFDGNYKNYRTLKLESSKKHSSLSKLYGAVWLIDYSLQALWGATFPMLFEQPEYFIADRYIYDAVVNLSLSLGISEQKSKELITLWGKIFPMPSKVFWVDLPEELAFSRKDDIPSLEYLQERRQLYRKFSKEFSFINLDGSKDRQILSKQVERVIINDC